MHARAYHVYCAYHVHARAYHVYFKTPQHILPQQSRVTDGGDSEEDSDDIWSDSYDESSSEDDVPAIGYTAAYFLKR